MHDVLIIGAGPAGLAVGIEAVKNGLDTIVIEKGTVVNSIVNFPKEMVFFSTSDLLEIGKMPFTSNGSHPTRREAILYYQKASDYHNLRINPREKVTAIRHLEESFEIQSTPWPDAINGKKSIYKSQNVVIATGFYDYPKRLNVQGEDLPNVSHYYSEPYTYYNKDVLIIGGGNSAVEAALDIFRHGGRVTVLHRAPEVKKSIKYWILPDFQNRVAEGSIKLIANAEVLELKHDGVSYKQLNKTKWHPCDDVLLLTGYQPDEEIYNLAGIGYNKETLEPTINQNTFESTQKGIYLAGSLIAGVFSNRIFIENSREHAQPIVEDILKKEK